MRGIREEGARRSKDELDRQLDQELYPSLNPNALPPSSEFFDVLIERLGLEHSNFERVDCVESKKIHF